MLFGSAKGTLVGKSLEGYANGREDLSRKGQPMARFLRDEATQTGETGLTLTITQAQYNTLLPGQHGTLSWWGERLSDFVPAGEEPALSPEPETPETPVTEAPVVEFPATEVPVAQASEALPVWEAPPPEPSVESSPEPGPSPALPQEVQTPRQTPPSPSVETAAPRFVCPWCGKAMGRWRMRSRDGFRMKEGERWTWSVESMKKLFLSEEVNKSIDLAGTHLLLWVCEDCKKAVVDYKLGACDGGTWM